MYVVYILVCKDGSLYTGITNDVTHRLAMHKAGKASRYTRSRGVKKMIVIQRCRTKGNALKRELQIKQLKRSEKLQLVSKINK